MHPVSVLYCCAEPARLIVFFCDPRSANGGVKRRLPLDDEKDEDEEASEPSSDEENIPVRAKGRRSTTSKVSEVDYLEDVSLERQPSMLGEAGSLPASSTDLSSPASQRSKTHRRTSKSGGEASKASSCRFPQSLHHPSAPLQASTPKRRSRRRK